MYVYILSILNRFMQHFSAKASDKPESDGHDVILVSTGTSNPSVCEKYFQ